MIARLDALSHERTFTGTQLTLLDVLQTRTPNRRCFHGPLWRTATDRTLYKRGACAGFRCPHCIHFRIAEVVLRAFRIWGNPDTIYTRTLTVSKHHRARIRADHPLHVVVNTATGFQLLFSPSPIEGGYATTALGLVDALLAAAPHKGKHVFEFSRSDECKAARAQAKAEDDVPAESKPASDTTTVPRRFTIGSARAADNAFMGWTDADWEAYEAGKRGQPVTEALPSRLYANEAERSRSVLFNEVLRNEVSEERELQRALRKVTKSSSAPFDPATCWDNLPDDFRTAADPEPEPQPQPALT